MSKQTLAAVLRHSLNQLPACEAQAALGGFIANVIGPIDDERWTKMRREAAQPPCGERDCGCETLRVVLFDALDKQRVDWREQMLGE